MSPKPKSFDWVVQDCLAAMAWPYDLNAALEYLQEQGVRVIVTLTERPLRMALIEEFGFEYHHLPVMDFHGPTQHQIVEFVAIVDRAKAAGKRVVTHCLAGRGRTGSMLAAYLVSQGLSPKDAMADVRRARPGSIESLEQEEAIRGYAQSLRKHS